MSQSDVVETEWGQESVHIVVRGSEAWCVACSHNNGVTLHLHSEHVEEHVKNHGE